MRNDYYLQGTVQALMLTDLVSSNTRYALQNRLDKILVTAPLFFDDNTFLTLRTVCTRLIPQPDEERRVDLAGCLDTILAEGKGNGWRYNKMPADGKAFAMGLYGINKYSIHRFGKGFHLLEPEEQDSILTSIQSGEATGLTWQAIPAKLFLKNCLQLS